MRNLPSAYSLPCGLYALSRDVANPRADGRCNWGNSPWRVPVWLEGWQFVVEHYDDGTQPTEAPLLRPLNQRDMLFFLGKNDDVLGALVPHLVPATVTLSALLKMHHAIGEGVLERLVRRGKLTLDDVRAAIEGR